VASVLSDVHCGSVEVEDALLIGVSAPFVKCKGCVLYNVVQPASEGGLTLGEGEVMADVYVADGTKIRMR
jgi:hypothetical protein